MREKGPYAKPQSRKAAKFQKREAGARGLKGSRSSPEQGRSQAELGNEGTKRAEWKSRVPATGAVAPQSRTGVAVARDARKWILEM